MHTHTFATSLILHFPAPSNTSGSVVTQTSNQNRCGGDSVGHGLLDSKHSWRKGSSINGITLSTLLIGMYFDVHAGFKTYCDRLVFHWLAIPWLQKEADSYVYDHNTSRRRANRRKILPNGIPDVMFENPETVDARDFKVSQYFDPKSYIHITLFVGYCSRHIDRWR